MDIIVNVHWLPELCLAHGDIRDNQLQYAWPHSSSHKPGKQAPRLTPFSTLQVEAAPKYGPGEWRWPLMPPNPSVLPDSKMLIHLELPKEEKLKKMQRKIQFDLLDAVLIGTLGHGLNYLRVS